ncbi:MAG TPA: DinB family protein [Thermoanaerobaculia bacterium]|nr:DinB family protein [Thermoanaerobaculia bacterium]
MREALWRQLGAAVDMLGNAIAAFPDEVWLDPARRPPPWHLAYHTLFFLDLYLSPGLDGFAPPAPFTLSELDPSGVLPERPYTRAELLAYLDHGRRKARSTLAGLTDEAAARPVSFPWVGEMSFGELLLVSLRHVQHGAAQLNLILRQTVDAAPEWVKRAAEGLDGG